MDEKVISQLMKAEARAWEVRQSVVAKAKAATTAWRAAQAAWLAAEAKEVDRE